jgi:hypothetical protein
MMHMIQTVSAESSISAVIHNPITLILYFLSFLGNYTHYLLFGLFIFCISIAIITDFICSNRVKDLLSLSLIINYMLVAALTGVGRMQLGIYQADSSRYVGFSLMVLLGCINYIHSNNNFPINRFKIFNRLNFKTIEIILALVLIASFSVGIHKSLNFSEFM